MGLFSYICPSCRSNIRVYEVAHFEHIRHGKVLGVADGTYDGYGRVFGNSIWADDNPNNINSNENLVKSQFLLGDSKEFSGKLFEGEAVNWGDFIKKMGYEFPPIHIKAYPDEVYDVWRSLDEPNIKPRSGISAYHKACWDSLSKSGKSRHTLSSSDEAQGCGEPRTKYM